MVAAVCVGRNNEPKHRARLYAVPTHSRAHVPSGATEGLCARRLHLCRCVRDRTGHCRVVHARWTCWCWVCERKNLPTRVGVRVGSTGNPRLIGCAIHHPGLHPGAPVQNRTQVLTPSCVTMAMENVDGLSAAGLVCHLSCAGWLDERTKEWHRYTIPHTQTFACRQCGIWIGICSAYRWRHWPGLFDGDYAVRFCSLRANKIYHMVPVVPTGVAVCSLVASLRSVNVDASRKTNRAGSTNIHRASYNESVGLGWWWRACGMRMEVAEG